MLRCTCYTSFFFSFLFMACFCDHGLCFRKWNCCTRCSENVTILVVVVIIIIITITVVIIVMSLLSCISNSLFSYLSIRFISRRLCYLFRHADSRHVNILTVSFPGDTAESFFRVRHGESLKTLIIIILRMVGFEPPRPKQNMACRRRHLSRN